MVLGFSWTSGSRLASSRFERAFLGILEFNSINFQNPTKSHNMQLGGYSGFLTFAVAYWRLSGETARAE